MTSTSEQHRDVPKAIHFNSIIIDVSFHPEKNIIAAGDIDGDITIHSYSTSEDNNLVLELTHHKKACRCISFSPDGTLLLTGSKDKSICVTDMESGMLRQTITKAHSCPLYSMCVADENIVATGDDEGTLKVWDLRQSKPVMEIKENDDFISDMILESRKRLLLATSGDGTLSAFDIRKHKMKQQSELFDSEMLSLAIVKGGNKVVVGNGDGALHIFNWGEWGNMSDRFPGHPVSIDCMLSLNDNIIFTGSFDGTVRAVNILPNRFLGVIGEHDGFPVENMSLSHCKTFLASCSHDQTLRFWNVSGVENEKIDISKKAKHTNKPKILNKALAAQEDFFSDLVDNNKCNEKNGDDADDNENSIEESLEESSDETFVRHSDQECEEDLEPDAGQTTSSKKMKAIKKHSIAIVNSDDSDETDI